MKKIMFICHGSICRSPMAEFVMKKLVREAGAGDEFLICSRAVSTEELGNDIYPPAKAELTRRGVPFERHSARQLARSDYGEWDLFVVMDGSNIRLAQRIFGSDPDGKLRRLMEFAGESRDVSDPWYTRRFDTAFDDILRGCKGLLESCLDGE